MKYYYNPESGVFVGSSNTDLIVKTEPYIEKEPGWFYADYRVNPLTLELIYEPVPRHPRR